MPRLVLKSSRPEYSIRRQRDKESASEYFKAVQHLYPEPVPILTREFTPEKTRETDTKSRRFKLSRSFINRRINNIIRQNKDKKFRSDCLIDPQELVLLNGYTDAENVQKILTAPRHCRINPIPTRGQVDLLVKTVYGAPRVYCHPDNRPTPEKLYYTCGCTIHFCYHVKYPRFYKPEHVDNQHIGDKKPDWFQNNRTRSELFELCNPLFRSYPEVHSHFMGKVFGAVYKTETETQE